MTTTTQQRRRWAARITWQPSFVGHAPLTYDNIVWATSASAAHREAARAFRETFPAGAIRHIAIERKP